MNVENQSLEEYKDASQNMRHYANHFVAYLSLFIAFNGGLLSVLFNLKQPESSGTEFVLQFIGLGTTVLLGVMTESAHHLWGHFMRRAAEIENQLQFKQYSSLSGAPKFWIRPTKWASRAMFVLMAFFWTFWLLGRLLLTLCKVGPC
jgi:hypothetical protein